MYSLNTDQLKSILADIRMTPIMYLGTQHIQSYFAPQAKGIVALYSGMQDVSFSRNCARLIQLNRNRQKVVSFNNVLSK